MELGEWLLEEYKAGRLKRKLLDECLEKMEFEQEREATIRRVRDLRLQLITWESARDLRVIPYRESFGGGSGI